MDDREFGGARTILGQPPPRDREVVVVRVHHDGWRVQLEVERAPRVAFISGGLLEEVEFHPWGGARFDGEVLTIQARNGVFRYRVDRVPFFPWQPTADGWVPPPEYRMQRIDEAA